jgi:ribose 5-phosphate isomerase B
MIIDWAQHTNQIGIFGNKVNTIILAADHNGVELKKYLYSFLSERGFRCIDLGPYTNKKSVDYTDYAYQLGQIIHNGDVSKGILICGTGVGMSIASNRFENVRAALVHNLTTAPKCREHNNSNILCLGSWITPPKAAEEICDAWLNTSFGEGRHNKRVEKISHHKPNTVVFTNGVFDIIHPGHIELLEFAGSLGDKLIVAINSDRSVKELKGSSRPVVCELDRKKILESIKEVDEVIIFDDEESSNIFQQIEPDIIVKGGEWTAEEVRKRDNIPDDIQIKIFPLVSDYSTTEILKKIKINEIWKKT